MNMNPVGPAIGAAVALLCLWFSLRQRRRHRLLSDLPTSKAQGVFIGLVELDGQAGSEAPLTSYLAEQHCVHFAWTVEEHWRRTRTETYTDSKGNTRTRTVTETGWATVGQGAERQAFYLRDDTGAVLVRPEGAKIEPLRMFSQTCSRGDELYFAKVGDVWVNGSTGTRRFMENGIPLHARLYAIGTARERSDVVAPELAEADGEEFILSCRGEAAVTRGLAWSSWLCWFAGLLAVPVGLFFGSEEGTHPDALIRLCLLAAGGFGFFWAAGWVWMVHDSLVSLRERVRRGWSLIEVELKRRHDLLPGLAEVVGGLGRHEAEVQRVVAALRTQAMATRPGVAGPEFGGVAAELRVVV